MLRVAVVTLLILVAQPAKAAQLPDYIVKAKRIVFLGDSVTHDGRFISFIEYQLRQLRLKRVPELINLGLPSETCSGLSEPDHPFPRPNVHERLDRALTKLKPDVVVACYGMNDGIYYPFIPSHFTDFKLGVQNLIKKVHKSGAKLVLMTPPAFDPLPMKKKGKLRKIDAPKFAWFGIYEKYDDVMARYAKWVLTLKKKVVGVIDMHTPMNDYLKEKRKTNPDFVLSGDGVHINYEGHLVFAGAILKA